MWTSFARDPSHRGTINVGREPRWCRSYSQYHKPHATLLNSQLMEQVNNDRLVVKSLWYGPYSFHDFILYGLSFRPELAILQTPSYIRRFLELYLFVTCLTQSAIVRICVGSYRHGLGRHIATFFYLLLTFAGYSNIQNKIADFLFWRSEVTQTVNWQAQVIHQQFSWEPM